MGRWDAHYSPVQTWADSTEFIQTLLNAVEVDWGFSYAVGGPTNSFFSVCVPIVIQLHLLQYLESTWKIYRYRWALLLEPANGPKFLKIFWISTEFIHNTGYEYFKTSLLIHYDKVH